jgi:hypothetical protein
MFENFGCDDKVERAGIEGHVFDVSGTRINPSSSQTLDCIMVGIKARHVPPALVHALLEIPVPNSNIENPWGGPAEASDRTDECRLPGPRLGEITSTLVLKVGPDARLI